MTAAGPLRVLVTGVTGQVGGALLPLVRQAGFEALAADRAALDLSAPEGIGAALDALAPDILVNPAAYTAVDKAEDERDLACRVNAEAPAAMARWCAGRGVPLVHLSTDYVFSGQGERPWREDDPIAPLSAYGASKAEGEARIRAEGAPALILRTSWVYDARGRNFLTTMLRLGRERDSLRVVADQRGTPTAAPSIARSLVVVLDYLARARARVRTGGDPAALVALCGTYHLTDGGETTWHGFAEAIFARAAPQWGGHRPVVEPIPTSAWPTPAARPALSTLDCGRFIATFGHRPPPWQDSLDAVMAEVFAASPSPSTSGQTP